MQFVQGIWLGRSTRFADKAMRVAELFGFRFVKVGWLGAFVANAIKIVSVAQAFPVLVVAVH